MKKSLYLYLCSLLGVMLFLILHRIVIFSYILLGSLGYEPFASGMVSLTFLVMEYFTLIIILILGPWYGIWIGLHWYEKVYEEGSSHGLVAHLADRYWPKSRNRYDLESKIIAVKQRLDTEAEKLETIAEEVPVALASAVEPVKKRVVRKRVVKK